MIGSLYYDIQYVYNELFNDTGKISIEEFESQDFENLEESFWELPTFEFKKSDNLFFGNIDSLFKPLN